MEHDGAIEHGAAKERITTGFKMLRDAARRAVVYEAVYPCD